MKEILFCLIFLFALGAMAQDKFLEHTSKDKVCPTNQSPINLQMPAKAANHTILFSYHPSHEVLENLGHTVKLLYDKGSKVSFDGQDYQLVQIHFHTPAEHHIDRKHHPMEAHLVHTRVDSLAYLVVALLFEEGAENAFLAKFISDIPAQKDSKTETKQTLDLNQLIPKDTQFYHYVGSLTTPPFTEGVKWLNCRSLLTASTAQIQKIKAYEGKNARKTQKLYHRKVEIFK